MHKISRIFTASLLMTCIYIQSEPEPLLKGSQTLFEQTPVAIHNLSSRTTPLALPDIRKKGFCAWCQKNSNEVATGLLLLSIFAAIHFKIITPQSA